MSSHQATESDKAEFHEVIFEAIPSPILVVDADMGLIDFNLAASRLSEAEILQVLHPRVGDAIRCVEAEGGPCGSRADCQQCVILSSTREALQGARVERRVAPLRLRLNGKPVVRNFLVSVAPFRDREESLAVVMLEDVAKLSQVLFTAPHARTKAATAGA